MATVPYRPQQETFEGWLFDLYPVPEGMVLWFLGNDGAARRVVDRSFFPSFYFRASSPDRRKDMLKTLTPFRDQVRFRRTERREFFRDEAVSLTEVQVTNPVRFPEVVSRMTKRFRSQAFFHCDISLEQMYFYESEIFPVSRVRVRVEENKSTVREIELRDDRWKRDYRIPSLRTLEVTLGGQTMNPRHGKRDVLEVTEDHHTRRLEGPDDRAVMEDLARIIRERDPDLIFTDWGDSWLIDRLRERARRTGVELPLNRDPDADMRETGETSYASYGRVVYHGGSRIFRGRWHIDRRNSFLVSESGLAGLVQLARISDMPVQTLARRSPGTSISSMQLAEAGSHSYLIPWRKTQGEAFKSARLLIKSDKGGLTYVPPVGFHERVAELDFASMFPTIMARFNISPETVRCPKCEGRKVPELGYTICENRRGLVPAVLEEVLSMRSDYKQSRDRAGEAGDKQEQERFDRRQTALKWILVTCFGYLGYKNARFGRIEAHESVTAYSRELLLRAKEMAENRGYRMLHAIVDSMWLSRDPLRKDACRELAADISGDLNIPLEMEGIFDWICFVPSKTNPSIGVSNRYFGVFSDGSVKSRGIALRRSDSPEIVCTTQQNMLDCLSEARTAEEYRQCIPEALTILAEYILRVREGEVNPGELAVTTRLSKPPDEYEHNTLSTCAIRWLQKADISLRAGEKISYIIRDRDSDIPEERALPLTLARQEMTYDREAYEQYLKDAGWTLVQPFLDTREQMELLLEQPPGERSFPDVFLSS